MSAAKADPLNAATAVRASNTFFILNPSAVSGPLSTAWRISNTVILFIDGSAGNAVAPAPHRPENGSRELSTLLRRYPFNVLFLLIKS
jgi:hypothetical protein